MLEFYIDNRSSTPVVRQIEEQIKLGVMMGVLRNGDTLPSIRDIEKQTGVSRNQIHRAYQALTRSGLLTLTRGKGTVVAAATASSQSINDRCQRLSSQIISRVRRMGVSPTAFVRYLGRQTQDNERQSPFICYVDTNKEIAAQTAAEISASWQAPVAGWTIDELKNGLAEGAAVGRVLANHMMVDCVRELIATRKVDAVPIEVRYSDETIRKLSRIEPGSKTLLVLWPQSPFKVQFITAQLRRWATAEGIAINHAAFRNGSSFAKLLKDRRYDYVLIGPGIRGEVPKELRSDRRLLLLDVQLDPESLEIARVRSGVIV